MFPVTQANKYPREFEDGAGLTQKMSSSACCMRGFSVSDTYFRVVDMKMPRPISKKTPKTLRDNEYQLITWS